jgi:hypothetical protein
MAASGQRIEFVECRSWAGTRWFMPSLPAERISLLIWRSGFTRTGTSIYLIERERGLLRYQALRRRMSASVDWSMA